jgi:GNAT superfamily N-acetyltransferase
MRDDLTLRHIAKTDWSWLEEWFRDPWLNRDLGPMDRDWLAHVLEDRGGVQLVAETGVGPAALIGVTWAERGRPYHVVTDLAVAPAQRRKGVGRASLTACLAWDGHPPTQHWRGYVARQNPAPAHLLATMGWTEIAPMGALRSFQWASPARADQTASGSDNSA